MKKNVYIKDISKSNKQTPSIDTTLYHTLFHPPPQMAFPLPVPSSIDLYYEIEREGGERAGNTIWVVIIVVMVRRAAAAVAAASNGQSIRHSCHLKTHECAALLYMAEYYVRS